MKARSQLWLRIYKGFNSASFLFQNNLGEKMRYVLGFQILLGDPYTWMKPYVKASGFKYYECIFTHVDDGIKISYKCDKIIKRLE